MKSLLINSTFNHSIKIGAFIFSFAVLLASCKTKDEYIATETFTIYGAADSISPDGKTTFLVPVAEHRVQIDSALQLKEKIKFLADTLSATHFNSLQIDIILVEEVDGVISMVVNLAEAPDYSGPGSVAPFYAWYDYFQGSYGGQSTSLILTNTLLQREYDGEWPGLLEILYNNAPIEEWDHINLSGKLER